MEAALNLDVEAARLMNKGPLLVREAGQLNKPFKIELRIPQQHHMSKAPTSAGRGVTQHTRLS